MGVVVGMLVGLVGIWNSIKARQRETKQDIETAIIRSEGRLKEFFEVRFKVVDTQTGAINQRLRQTIRRPERPDNNHRKNLSRQTRR